jgi:hypothetical protein
MVGSRSARAAGRRFDSGGWLLFSRYVRCRCLCAAAVCYHFATIRVAVEAVEIRENLGRTAAVRVLDVGPAAVDCLPSWVGETGPASRIKPLLYFQDGFHSTLQFVPLADKYGLSMHEGVTDPC